MEANIKVEYIEIVDEILEYLAPIKVETTDIITTDRNLFVKSEKEDANIEVEEIILKDECADDEEREIQEDIDDIFIEEENQAQKMKCDDRDINQNKCNRNSFKECQLQFPKMLEMLPDRDTIKVAENFKSIRRKQLPPIDELARTYQNKHKLIRPLSIHLIRIPVELKKVENPSRKYSNRSKQKTNCKDQVSRNIKLSHETFHCVLCEFYTKDKYYLKKHMLVHKREDEVKLYTCEVCKFTTKRQKSFRRHALRHLDADNARMYSCKYCQYKTKYSYALTRHCLLHADQSHPKNKGFLRCGECSYGTSEKNVLLSHIASSHGELNLFSCNDCNYSSNRKENLIKHIKLVHKSMEVVKTFKCTECDYENKRNWHLQRHIAKVHKNLKK